MKRKVSYSGLHAIRATGTEIYIGKSVRGATRGERYITIRDWFNGFACESRRISAYDLQHTKYFDILKPHTRYFVECNGGPIYEIDSQR